MFGVAVFLTLLSGALAQAAERPNVLFIAVDDLRPQLNCYGKQFMHSPNIDKLAERGVLFERAYCMVPTCGASRASLMTGIRPAPKRFVNYLTWAEKDAPGAVTLNTHFKEAGYTTISLGKVFHHATDNVQGWSERPYRTGGLGYQKPDVQREAMAKHRKKYPGAKQVRGMPYEAADTADENYRDGQNALKAIEYLEAFAEDPHQPFFLAVGFYKPHLPFVAPQKYWDLYDFDSIHVPSNYHPPKDVPKGAMHTSGELRAYAGVPPKGPVDDLMARKLIHGYYACVSFTDAQIGKILDSLDRLNLSDDTIIVLWGDHGWQLGEHGMWNKHSCFETSMHAPLLIAAPTKQQVKPGTRVRALTEFIDIYPTLCDLAGLPAPGHLEGNSLVPLMLDPEVAWKSFAIGRYRTGDTIRTDHFRFSEYSTARGEATGNMLYDHRVDPDENVNVASAAEHDPVVAKLKADLRSNKGR
jgi:arylsulfatase A-like enzyme